MIEVDDIHTYYGDSYVLQGVTLSVGEGEIVCLLGRNGAGKTTTIRSIMGYTPPRKGRVTLEGQEVTRLPVYSHVRLGMGYVPEDRQIFPDLTVDENLEVAMLPARRDRRQWTRERVYRKFPALGKLCDHKGGALSGGEQQMLSIARALMGDPKVLLLDEPCEGLAPIIVDALREIILELKRDMPVLMAEQNARFAFDISDRGFVIDKGRMRYEGSIEELAADKEIQSRYLAV
jgi:branched-chain amino acid transport system ATP-binding protein